MNLNKVIIFFAFIVILFSCQKEKQVEQDDEMMEELKKAIEADNSAVELATYEYVCNHCKIGSHEAGSCPCGMDFEINAEFRIGDKYHDESISLEKEEMKESM